MKPFDIARARRDTPGADHVLHLNNAGAALPPAPVVETVIDHLQLEAACGGYEAAEQRQAELTAAYLSAARLLNCRPDEIAVTDCATRGWDMAFHGVRLGRGDRIITGMSEYSSNYISFLRVTERTGAVIDVIGNDESGQICLQSLAARLDSRAKLIAITHVPTSGGLVNPAAGVGAIARAAGVPFLLDACQSVGQMPVDVQAIGCDMLSTTGRKWLRAPRGTGLLYVSAAMLERLDPPFLDDHGATWTSPDTYQVRKDARRFETWECNVAAKLGLGRAIDYALAWGLSAIQSRVTGLAANLRRQLAGIPGIRLHDTGAEMCGIVTFSVDARSPRDVKSLLAARRMNVTVASRLATQLDMTARGLHEIVRASVHYYNTEDEIDRFVGAIAGLLGERSEAGLLGSV